MAISYRYYITVDMVKTEDAAFIDLFLLSSYIHKNTFYTKGKVIKSSTPAAGRRVPGF